MSYSVFLSTPYLLFMKNIYTIVQEVVEFTKRKLDVVNVILLLINKDLYIPLKFHL